jgi:drug/metabolite transporter (DMT)-like permease
MGLVLAVFTEISAWRGTPVRLHTGDAMRPLHLILLVGMNLFWAGTYSIYKVLGEHLNSGKVATLRFGLATVCLLAAWPWLPGRGPRGRELWRAVVIGAVVFCAAPRLQVEAVHRGQAGDTSLLVALEPLVTALAAAVFLREHIAPRRWWGFALGMAGVVLLSNLWQGATPLRGLLPNLLFVTSFFCEATYSVAGKPLLDRVGIFKLLGSSLVVGTAVNLSLEALSGSPVTPSVLRAIPWPAWLWLLYLAVVCTVIGYALWYLVIKETEVNITSLTVFIQPVTGLLLSVLWLKEPTHWGQLWGSLVIVGGLVVGLQRNGRPPAKEVVGTGASR